VLNAAGLAKAFTHGLGHGVGLEIHEPPIMTATIEATLEVGEVITVEPGIYFPGVGGIRIEDTLVITDTGSRSLTTLSRDLVRLA
jgi:Xaa-Pro aminopeptidase